MYISKPLNKLRLSLAVLALALGMGAFSFASTSPVHAQLKDELCGGANLSLDDSNKDCTPNGESPTSTVNDTIGSIINIFTVIVGITAVIMILVGGFRYITSGGDSGKTASARNTILYALIGLVIVALAQFIVKFVLKKVTS